MRSNCGVVVAVMAAATLSSVTAFADDPPGSTSASPPASPGGSESSGNVAPGSDAPTSDNSHGEADTAPLANEPVRQSTAPAASTRVAAAAQPAAPPPEDDGRQTDLLFIQAEGGTSYVDLTALSSQGRLLPSLTEFRGTGYGGGVSVGMRASILAIAASGYIARFSGEGINRAMASDPSSAMPTQTAFDLGQVMLEAQLRIPVPIIEPYARIGLGYAWMGAFELNDMYRNSTSGVQGFTGKLGLGADLWIAKVITVGVGLDFTLLNLRRGGVTREDSACPQTMPTCVELRMDGDAVGMMTHFHVQAGVHF